MKKKTISIIDYNKLLKDSINILSNYPPNHKEAKKIEIHIEKIKKCK